MTIDNYQVEIIKKQIKNINLKVYPDLTIRASIPQNMDMNLVKRMIAAKSDWICTQLERYAEQRRVAKRHYVSGEDHYLNGKRYILRVYDSYTHEVKVVNNHTIAMYVRKDSSIENKEKLMNSFYRKNLIKKLEKYVPIWEEKIGVKSNEYAIRKMKNKWGSCNSRTKQMNFNLELAKKKDVEIQYVIIHELLHLKERNHNEKFRTLMNQFCPKWEIYHDSLNDLLNPNIIY